MASTAIKQSSVSMLHLPTWTRSLPAVLTPKQRASCKEEVARDGHLAAARALAMFNSVHRQSHAIEDRLRLTTTVSVVATELARNDHAWHVSILTLFR